MIQIDAALQEREKRVLKRNDFVFKNSNIETMEKRDKEFEEGLKKSKQRKIDIKISNEGSIQELQEQADNIYQEIIKDSKHRKNPMVEKYGGYKIKPVDMSRISARNKTSRESDKTK